MQPKEIVLLGGPAAGSTWRGRGWRRLGPESRGAPAYRLAGTTQALCHLLQSQAAGGHVCETLVVLGAPAARIGGQTELAGAGSNAARAGLRQLAGDLGAALGAGVAIPE